MSAELRLLPDFEKNFQPVLRCSLVAALILDYGGLHVDALTWMEEPEITPVTF